MWIIYEITYEQDRQDFKFVCHCDSKHQMVELCKHLRSCDDSKHNLYVGVKVVCQL